MLGSCLRHHSSGFVWQQEARPLHILGTSKPGKSLHPSQALPQSNSAPTCLTISFPGEKFPSALLEIAAQSGPLLQDGWAPCPSQSPDGNLPPTPHRRAAVPGCLQRLVQCRHSRMPQSRGEGRAAAMRSSSDECRAAPRSSRNAGTRRSAANHTAAGGGEEMQSGSRGITLGALLGAQKQPHTPSPALPSLGIHRSRRPNCSRVPTELQEAEFRTRTPRASSYTLYFQLELPHPCLALASPVSLLLLPSELLKPSRRSRRELPDRATAVPAEQGGHGTGPPGARGVSTAQGGQELPGSARSPASSQGRRTAQHGARPRSAQPARAPEPRRSPLPGSRGRAAHSH